MTSIARNGIRAPEGRMLIKADYSQIGLRIAAKISGDQGMLAAYQKGEDLHIRTAESLADAGVGKEDRKLAKAVNFGLLYGQGARASRSSRARSTRLTSPLRKPPSTSGGSLGLILA